MSFEHLWAPWRFGYVQNARKAHEAGCLFCELGKSDDAARDFRLYASEEVLVVLNLYPYATGHLMVAPRGHFASPTEASDQALSAFYRTVVYAERAVRAAYHPEGLNVGMNLGIAAGAGVPGHFHMHLVPRWVGDTNFMAALGGTRVHPEGLASTWQKLLPFFDTGPLPPDHPLFLGSTKDKEGRERNPQDFAKGGKEGMQP